MAIKASRCHCVNNDSLMSDKDFYKKHLYSIRKAQKEIEESIRHSNRAKAIRVRMAVPWLLASQHGWSLLFQVDFAMVLVNFAHG